ncbi:MAG: hypothetical protein FWF45_07560 [Coriobacteriia bacterium]|nr:hypothetical protein [Coriobacteriia bacterium]
MFGCSPLILKLENIDLVNVEFCAQSGEIVQDPRSIYKIAQFPGETYVRHDQYPGGTHVVQKLDDRIVIEIGIMRIECFADNSWRYQIEDAERGFKADLVHKPLCGGPLWYGRNTPSHLTQHSTTYGYNWSGQVEGNITYDGRTVHVKGAGIRERYVATDSSSAEIGGWEDWGWFHFDEAFGSMYDMKLGMKDFALNLVDGGAGGQYFPEGDFAIEHHEWVYLPQYGGFIPSEYKIRFEVEAGVLELCAHCATATTWGVTANVPDNPVATLMWDRVEGTFTSKEGQVKTLTNGFGGMSIRQWRPYPSITPPISAEGLTVGERFTTL